MINIIAGLISWMIRAWCLWIVWPLVMVTAFHLPELTFLQGAYLILIVDILTQNLLPSEKNKDKKEK